MAFFDTHTHLNIEPLLSKAEVLINACGVENILINVVGIDRDTSLVSLSLSKKFWNVFSTIGVHPSSIEEIAFDDLNNFFSSFLEKNNEKVIGIGETGLDYHTGLISSEKQKKYFIEHIRVAKKYNKTLVVHVRDAHNDLITLLKTYGNGVKTIIHCFSGTVENANQYIQLGCYISFSGIVTFKNAVGVVEAARTIPLDKILIETDCPWLAPQPNRGKENIPQYVKYVYESLKKIRNEPNLENILFENSLNAFSINKKTLFK